MSEPLVDPDFMAAVKQVLTAGLKDGRTPNDFVGQPLPDVFCRCRGAIKRHMDRASIGKLDDESGESHWAHVAAHAYMLWMRERKEMQDAGEG